MDSVSRFRSGPQGLYVVDGQAILRYTLEADGQLLMGWWLPGSTIEQVKLGFLELQRLLAVHRCPALLTDASAYVGDWSELIPWAGYEVLPAAMTTGLRYLAAVWPSDPANSLALYRWQAETQGVLQHRIFHDLASAHAWVLEALRSDAA